MSRFIEIIGLDLDDTYKKVYTRVLINVEHIVTAVVSDEGTFIKLVSDRYVSTEMPYEDVKSLILNLDKLIVGD